MNHGLPDRQHGWHGRRLVLPKIAFGVTVILSAAAAVGMAWIIGSTYQQQAEQAERELRSVDLQQRLLHLDEVLTSA